MYLRKIRVRLILLIPLVPGAFGGSTVGAALSRSVPREVLTPIVLVAVVAVGVYTLVKPKMGLQHEPRHDRPAAIACWRGRSVLVWGSTTASWVRERDRSS